MALTPERAVSEQELRERLLIAALDCVQRFGIRRCPMSEVARCAGVSRATLYRYYPDKDTLVEAMLDYAGDRFCDAAEAVIAMEPDLSAKIVRTVLWCRHEARSGMHLQLDQTDPESWVRLAMRGRHFQRCLAFWPEHVRLAQKAGEIRPELDPQWASDLILRFVLGLVLLPPLALDPDAAQQLHRYVEDYLMRGLTGA